MVALAIPLVFIVFHHEFDVHRPLAALASVKGKASTAKRAMVIYNFLAYGA